MINFNDLLHQYFILKIIHLFMKALIIQKILCKSKIYLKNKLMDIYIIYALKMFMILCPA
jgi:hypothetical protein